MPKKPETNLRTRIKKRLERRYGPDIFLTVIHGNSMQQSGLPDLMGVLRGRFVGLEVKQPGKEPSPIQAHTLAQIVRAGGIAGAITSYEEAEALLET